MAHYTESGIEKLRQQAETTPALVRCPRDGVVMRVLGGEAQRLDGSDDVRHFTKRVPNLHRWRVMELDLECPACRRRAERVLSHVSAGG